MMVLQLRQLLYLCTLADTGSYHTAARKLFITQPTLSIAIKKLEDQLQLPLFLRENKEVIPTEAGYLLLSTARKILAMDEELEESLKTLQEKQKNRLRIGTYLIFSTLVMPAMITRFHKAHPQVELQLQHNHQRELMEGLRQKRYDLLFGYLDTCDPALATLALRRDGLMVALPAAHPLCKKAKALPGQRYPYLPAELLGNETLLLQSDVHQIRQQENKVLRQLKERPKIREIESLEIAVRLAAEGMGVAFCMEAYVKHFHPAKPVSYFLTGDPAHYPWLVACYRKKEENNPLLKDFLALLQEIVTEIL